MIVVHQLCGEKASSSCVPSAKSSTQEASYVPPVSSCNLKTESFSENRKCVHTWFRVFLRVLALETSMSLLWNLCPKHANFCDSVRLPRLVTLRRFFCYIIVLFILWLSFLNSFIIYANVRQIAFFEWYTSFKVKQSLRFELNTKTSNISFFTIPYILCIYFIICNWC